MDRIDAMRAFVTAVDKGSLAAAARSLHQSPASITRAVTLLEARLGVRILHRSTRALHPTPFGESYLATCREVLTALDRAERGAASELERPSGLLTLTAPLGFGHLHFRPVLDEFLQANPAVQARLVLIDRVVNLVEEGVDAAVRIADLADSTLVATRLGEVRQILCAAPSYLKRRGAPQSPAAIRDHDCVLGPAGADVAMWRFLLGPGKPLTSIPIRPRLVVNSAAAAIDSAVGGHGVTRVLSYQAAAAVTAGDLVVLLPQHEPPPVPVHLVTPTNRSTTAKQRAFVAFAVPRLRERIASAEKDIAG